MKSGSGRPVGLIHLVARKNTSSVRCENSRTVEKLRDRKTSSPTNRQLTVHLYRNCLLNSNARDKYPSAFVGRKGSARTTYEPWLASQEVKS